MDSFFKAAVCDLDKLLDDFELSSDELGCRPTFLKPPAYFSDSSVTQGSIPDLSSLHYGSACVPAGQNSIPEDGEDTGQPLTGVDLLSSVDRVASQCAAPPCPDRALKPVCDLVNDASSAILVQSDSHDAYCQLDAQMEEEEGLLVDFDAPVLTLQCQADASAERLLPLNQNGAENVGGLSNTLSLLDVILPAAMESGCESLVGSEGPPDSRERPEEEYAELVQRHLEEDSVPPHGVPDGPVSSESEVCIDEDPPLAGAEAPGLSCLPLAVSMCGTLTAPEESEETVPEHEESNSGSNELADLAAPLQLAQVQVTPDQPSPKPPADSPTPPTPPDPTMAHHPPHHSESSLVHLPEFGFEYLPESDQAELLVTDEELDAFLLAHSQSGPDQDSSEPDHVVEEVMCCSHADPEDLATPESDRTMFVPVEGTNPSVAPPSLSLDVCLAESEAASPTSTQLYNRGSEEPPSHGGARPKQLNCQSTRSPPTGEEEDEQAWVGASVDSPSPGTPSDLPASIPSNAAQECLDYCCDELSEPPPYPGEPAKYGFGPATAKEEEQLGSRQPAWVPDADAPACMNCEQRFTFTKRRHHCRACGKVYCAVCCSRKCKLKYLEKEARVCLTCFDTIHRAQAIERMMSPTGPSPNPNIPSEYCSTIPPLQQARAAGTLNSPPPTVMVPVSVLKHPTNDACPREQKRVWFADGILPNGEVADTTKLSSRRSSQDLSVGTDQNAPELPGTDVSPSTPAAEVVRPASSGPWDFSLLCGISGAVRRTPSLLPDDEDQLPPLLLVTREDGAGDVLVEESPAPCQIRHLLEEGGPRPLTFVLNANLLVNVKLVTYGSGTCWCFGSVGLQAVGQKELVFLLECLPDERTLPRDLFSLCLSVYQDALRGKFVNELDNVTFTSSFLGSKDHAGMVFFSHTCQPLEDLTLPEQPFLFGLLVQKLEVPWAKVFPLRLLLRLGAEYNVYPTTLVSVRHRASVYRETGHTIMNLLADLRNYQYSLSSVEGLRIHMEVGHIYIDVPRSSFHEVQKVVNSSNEHVISIGATFSSQADSHLVCFQNQDGAYQTHASSVPGKTRTVTGASFVVFNGALKASSGFIAKSSIVEDGLMVQIPPETMESLRAALREQTDFHIQCGRSDGGEVKENVTVRWVSWSKPVNTGRKSAVDGKPLDGAVSVRVQQDVEFESDTRVIRCTEVFYQSRSPDCSLASLLATCSVFQKEIAVAACGALTPHLAVLTASGINSLSLRICTQPDMVEYVAGSGGRLLPQRYMNELDGALIPVIHGGNASVPQTQLDLEFCFFITHSL
ncbi:zinc finger FYVE domain-containing protein 16 isoform X2 [Synchiropus splendidus]|uniref:zinc finger FYVE domain-containing protein 16 isoform X2 n=1 Tax=Synchiropus splendidus TaxID=270530 RepID=UPI00237E5402|nr:zinc finger FYVE domain-containing protein 16 isoform X2 [Synchiropus splendidus]